MTFKFENATLPCGARVVAHSPAGGRVVVKFDKHPHYKDGKRSSFLSGFDYHADGSHSYNTLPALTEAQAPAKVVNPAKKYQTRNGWPVVIHTYFGQGPRPIVGQYCYDGTWVPYCWALDGLANINNSDTCPMDLVEVPEPDVVTYANVYSDSLGCETRSTSSLAKGSLGLIRITRSHDRKTLKSVEIVK